MVQGELFPKEPGWEYGQVLPLAQRPIPYAGALRPELALPDVLRSPINEITRALTLPQRTVLGQVAPSPEDALGFAMAMTGVGMGGSSLVGVPSNALGAMIGWHGTGAKFEPVEHNPFGEFKDVAIGSGEGGSAYGWGHYVAEEKKVAEVYQKELSRGPSQETDELRQYFKPGKLIPGYGGTDKVLKFYNPGEEGNPYPNTWATKVISVDYEGNPIPGHQPRIHANAPSRAQLEKAGVKSEPRGSLYKVQVKSDEHELLDWDKLLGQQAQGIQDLIKNKFGQEVIASDMTGGDWYNTLAGTVGNATLSDALHKAGIPGIKYLDQGSRGSRFIVQYKSPNTESYISTSKFDTREDAEKHIESLKLKEPARARIAETPESRNYVIFHPKNLKVIGRNGEELPVESVEHDPWGGAQVSSEARQLSRAIDRRQELEDVQLGLGQYGVKQKP